MGAGGGTSSESDRPDRHLVVVGGGIAGLCAAWAARRDGPPGLRITVVEQSGQTGGKLRTSNVAGNWSESGAETFLARVPDAVNLAREVGLGPELRYPAITGASLLVEGRLRPLPARTLLGIPADFDALAESGIFPPSELRRLRGEPEHPGPSRPAEDVSVGEFLRPRLGDLLVDRLIDPLLGGVYAGRADDLSLDTTVPALGEALRQHASVVMAARAVLAAGSRTDSPVFATVTGGLSRLADAVASASGAQLLLGMPVRQLDRTINGWRVVVGPTRAPRSFDADAVVLAVPAKPASRLLAGPAPAAAAELGVLDYASVALVTLAVPVVSLPSASLPAGTGFLVPAAERLAVKAATFLSRKWGVEPADGLTLVRASIGRYGEETVLQRSDTELVDTVAGELGQVLGGGQPLTVVESRVDRWGGALPQYTPGHGDRIRRARLALAGDPSLALAGAACDGVGIPACIRSGITAGTQVGRALSR
jgi:oxygen-dependent protoporphyrinogen oxidase